MLKTERLILRSFRDTDTEDLYAYAQDPRVGPIAGWPVHGSLEETREIIRTVFAVPHVFALELRETGRVVGSAGLVGRHPAGEFPDCPDDEIGYALSPACWGRGLVPEAVGAVLEYSFTKLGLHRVWCGHYAGNWRSDRVIRKCGFRYQFSRTERVCFPEDIRLTYYFMQTREEWRERVSSALSGQ